MSRALSPVALAAALALSLGCCGLFDSKEERFKKYFECADRLTVDRAIPYLEKGQFCCERLPAGYTSREAARRFYLEKARDLRPEAPEPYDEIGRSYWFEGRFADAEGAYALAAERAARPFPQRVILCAMQRIQKKYDAALATAAAVRATGEPDAEKAALYLEARIRYEQGRLEEAREGFTRALALAEVSGYRLRPSPYVMRDAWFYMAQIRLKGGDPQGAHEDFSRFLEKTGDPDFQSWYGGKILPMLGTDQPLLYDTIESDWVRERQ